MKAIVLAVTFVALGACGSTQWRPISAQAPSVVYVTEPCQVVPLQAPKVPAKSRCADGRPACYDGHNAELLARRIAGMQRWISEARSNCAIMEYRKSAYRLLPPYRRGSQITAGRIRLTAGAGYSPGTH